MDIKGKLSLLTKGLKDSKEIIGKPITLDGGKEIGIITGIDQEKDIYILQRSTMI